MSHSAPEPPPHVPPDRRPRWGFRTLGFLGLSLLAVMTSVGLGGHTFGTLGSLVVGLVGAAYCSVKGVRSAFESGEVDIFLGRRPRR